MLGYLTVYEKKKKKFFNGYFGLGLVFHFFLSYSGLGLGVNILKGT